MKKCCSFVLWGKCANGRRHPLTDHCLDVALVFRALLDLPHLARLSPLDDLQKERLSVLCFLHDFGKCNWGFQAKADPTARETAGHVMEAMALLCELPHRWPPTWRELLEVICSWFADSDGGQLEAGMAMLLAALSHHGRPVSFNDYRFCNGDRLKRFWISRDDYDPLVALEVIAKSVREYFPRAFSAGGQPIQATPALQQRFAGLVMLADWVASDTQFFPYRASADEDRLVLAREQAERALSAIGLRTPQPRTTRGFSETFRFPPSPLQELLAESLPIGEGSRLILIESDTGSGKTEAALAWWQRLYTQGEVDGLYFALPTRVAAREIYKRVQEAVQRAFDESVRPAPVLLAVPGYVQVGGQRVGNDRAILSDPVATRWEDFPQDQQRESVWAAERPKRFLAAPVAVGTIDQALLSVLRVKHSLLRSVCLDRHLLVVDEVHASDTYMREVLGALLHQHLKRGGYALLLSATLGESAAASFFARKIEPLLQAVSRPYPLVTTLGTQLPVASGRPPRRIQIELRPILSDDQALLPEIAAALEAGARVLVVCNTVGRANSLFRRIEAYLNEKAPHLLGALFAPKGVASPHHGRFARADRELLDAQVSILLGKQSPSGPRLLVGTQTLEQSLDIDADWLITDLAPMDVLIQRLGRLHRHLRDDRPVPYSTPRALIRVPARPLSEFLDDQGVLRAPAGLGRIGAYADGRVLQRTWDLLTERGELTLPQDARTLIEGATHPEALACLPEVWRRHGNAIDGENLAEIRAALGSVLRDEAFGELHYPEKDERIVTRLGADTYELPLTAPMRSPFGVLIDRIPIPAHWLPERTTLPDALDAEPVSDGLRILIGSRAFRYTRFGMERDDA